MIKKKSSNSSYLRKNDNALKDKDYSALENNFQNRKIMNGNNEKENYKNKIYDKNKEKRSIFFKKQNILNKNVKVNVSPIKKSHKRFNMINHTDINRHDGRCTPFQDNRVKKINNYSSKNFSNIIEYAKDLPLKTNEQSKKFKRVVTQKKLIVYDNVYHKRNIQNDIKNQQYLTDYTFDNFKFISNNFNSSDNIIEIEENQEYYDYDKLESKIYKNAIKKSFNRLIKYCHSFIKNDYQIFLNKLKSISLQNYFRPKAYKKKSVINRNMAAYQNFSSQYSTNNIKSDFSPIDSFKSIKTAKLKFEENNVANSTTKKNDTYSSYYNINGDEGKESNSNTIKSNKTCSKISSNKDKIKFVNEFKSDIYVKKNNIKSKKLNNNECSALKEKSKTNIKTKIINEYNTLTDKKENDFKINNYDNNIKTLRQNQSIILNKSNLLMDNDIKTLRQNQSIVFDKKSLIIENKNSFNYLNKSSQKSKSKKKFDVKKGILDKIKVNIVKNKDEMKMQRKKTYFKLFINKLRNFAFCVHMQNLMLNKNSENNINISSSAREENLENEETKKMQNNNINKNESITQKINNNYEKKIKSNNNENILNYNNIIKEEKNSIDDLNNNTIKEENNDNENNDLNMNTIKEENNDNDDNINENLAKEDNKNNGNINENVIKEENIKNENIIGKKNNENNNEKIVEEKNNENDNEKINEEKNNENDNDKIDEEKNNDNNNKNIEEKNNKINKVKINEENNNENYNDKNVEEKNNESKKEEIIEKNNNKIEEEKNNNENNNDKIEEEKNNKVNNKEKIDEEKNNKNDNDKINEEKNNENNNDKIKEEKNNENNNDKIVEKINNENDIGKVHNENDNEKIYEENNKGNDIGKINEDNNEKIDKEKSNENNKESINSNENNNEKIDKEKKNEDNNDKIVEEKRNEIIKVDINEEKNIENDVVFPNNANDNKEKSINNFEPLKTEDNIKEIKNNEDKNETEKGKENSQKDEIIIQKNEDYKKEIDSHNNEDFIQKEIDVHENENKRDEDNDNNKINNMNDIFNQISINEIKEKEIIFKNNNENNDAQKNNSDINIPEKVNHQSNSNCIENIINDNYNLLKDENEKNEINENNKNNINISENKTNIESEKVNDAIVNEESISQREDKIKKIFNNISDKDINNKKQNVFREWLNKRCEENKIQAEENKKDEMIKIDETKTEIEIVNKEVKNINMFGDDIKDDEKKVILDEMLHSFRMDLILFYLKKHQNIFDSYEINSELSIDERFSN